MRYPVGTRVWVRLLGATWLGYIHKPSTKRDFHEVRFNGPDIFAPFYKADITAALIPGPTDDHRPLARQLERYARYATPTHPAKDTAK